MSYFPSEILQTRKKRLSVTKGLNKVLQKIS